MTETNELSHTIERVEQLLNQGEISGAITCLEHVKNHALTAVKLINDQNSLLTKQQLEYISLFGELQTALEENAVLVKDVEIQKERADMQYKRAVSAEAEINELDEQEPLIYIKHDTAESISTIQPVVSARFSLNFRTDLALDEFSFPLYARPVPAKSVPDGFAIVPIAANDEMLAAAWDIETECHNHGKHPDIGFLGEIKAAEVWNKMISAYKNQGE